MLERTNARALTPERCLPYAPDLIVADVSFISLTQGAAGGAGLRRAALRRAGDGQAAVRGRPGARRQGRRRARRRPTAARRSSLVAGAAQAPARRCSASPPRGCPGPKGNRETFVWLAEAGRAGAVDDLEAAAAVVEPVSGASADRHGPHPHAARRRPPRRCARSWPRPSARASTLRFDAEETRKHGLRPSDGLVARRAAQRRRRAVRRARRRRHDPARAAPLRGHERAGVRGQLRRGRLPGDGRSRGDVDDGASRGRSRATSSADAARRSRSRRPTALARRDQRRLDPPQRRRARRRAGLRDRRRGGRVGALRRARGRHAGRARRATTSPTAGRCMAWGVEGFVVSFIAPHSLTARALVVAPDDLLTVHNRSARAVDVSRRRAPGGRARAGRGDRRALRARGGATSRSCRGRRSTGACARSSGG